MIDSKTYLAFNSVYDPEDAGVQPGKLSHASSGVRPKGWKTLIYSKIRIIKSFWDYDSYVQYNKKTDGNTSLLIKTCCPRNLTVLDW